MTASVARDADHTAKTDPTNDGKSESGEQDHAIARIASDESDRRRRERNKPFDGFSLGAPLTAAFIGGFLVIENLAGADQPEDGLAAVEPDDTLLDQPEGEDDPDASAAGGQATAASSDTAGGGPSPDDPAAAPSEDVASPGGADGIGDGPAMPAIAAASSGAPMPEAIDGDGADVNLNVFDINIDNGETEAGTDEAVESEILQRRKQVGTPGDDVLIGTDGDDAISGGSGDDIIHGLGGRDLLNGNEGDDQLFGGAGRDILKGGAGNDILDGGEDYDNLLGGSGDDVLIIDGRHDVALDYDSPANSGEDTLVVRQGYADDMAESGISSSTFFFSSETMGDQLPSGVASHAQQVAVGIEHLILEGIADHDIVADSGDNRLQGNAGANVIHGGAGNDQLFGGAGNDRLNGDRGHDVIKGGSGNDVMAGGLGKDELYGDGGDDVFVVGLNDSAIDTVFDHSGANRIKLEGVADQTVQASLLDDDLYVTVDDTPVVKVSGYVGNESALAGIDFGQGLRAVDTLLTEHADLEGAVQAVEAAADDDILSAHLHLTEPTLIGDRRADQRLDGTEGDDWLSGLDGRDTLYGHDGDDILEGGDDSDKLRGGAGDDRYLFSKGEEGIDIIRDSEGRNLAELKGYDHAKIEGTMFGDDLRVLADGDLLFAVEDFAQHQGAFKGVQAGSRFIETEDLLA